MARTRALLKTLLTYASREGSSSSGDAALLSDAAEQALAVAPGDAAWQQIAASLLAVRKSVSNGRHEKEALRQVIRTIADHASRELPAVSTNEAFGSRLRSAWSEAQRR